MDGKRGYDVREVIANVVDDADFLEVQAGFAMSIVVGFARILRPFGRESSPTSQR